MKVLPTLAILVTFAASAFADAPNFLRKDDKIRIQPMTPLPGNVTEVKVIEAGLGGPWVQVEFERPARNADGSVGVEKAKMWLNFDHIISVQRLDK